MRTHRWAILLLGAVSAGCLEFPAGATPDAVADAAPVATTDAASDAPVGPADAAPGRPDVISIDGRLPPNPTADGWRVLSAGHRHTCGITLDGKLYCWGDNEHGQLGLAPGPRVEGLRQTASPQRVTVDGAGPPDGEWVGVSAGATHTCALFDEATSADTSDDTLWCWGDDQLGQVSGAPGEESGPRRVDPAGAKGFTEVSAGTDHTCALRGGELFCWGDNASGQLGGDTCGQSPRGPVPVDANGGWRHVAAGQRATCAIRGDGALLCWGSDASGRLGDGPGDGTCSWPRQPIAVPDDRACASGWDMVSTSDEHVCAVRCREVWCWGRDNEGQISVNGGADWDEPHQITHGEGNWVAVVAGGGHTCALDARGRLECLGWDASGQLGGGFGVSGPTHPVAAGHAWSGVTAGQMHTCALQVGGGAACWGEAAGGRLGETPEADGPTGLLSDHHLPARVQEPPGVEGPWTAVGAGLLHTCGVKDRRLFCWGRNTREELSGINPAKRLAIYPSPVEVMADIADVDANDDSTCAIDLDGNGRCWPNASPEVPGRWKQIAVGQGFGCGIRIESAGDPTGDLCCWRLDDNQPTCRSDGTRWRAVTARGGACALDDANRLFCWNEQALGAVCVQPQDTPLAISETPFLEVAASIGTSVCGIDESHTLHCGQWGLGEPESACEAGDLSPAPAPEGVAVLAVRSADLHRCLIAGDAPPAGAEGDPPPSIAGTLWCWGRNVYGELGNGSASSDEDTEIPTRVLTGMAVEPQWTSVRLGGIINLNSAHTCGIQTDGTLWCWGRNVYGQLGTGEFSPAEPRALAVPAR